MSRSILTAILVVLLGAGTRASGQTVWYVDDDAAAGGDGLSWGTAYNDLHDALTTAQSGDQIWVAAGTPFAMGERCSHDLLFGVGMSNGSTSKSPSCVVGRFASVAGGRHVAYW